MQRRTPPINKLSLRNPVACCLLLCDGDWNWQAGYVILHSSHLFACGETMYICSYVKQSLPHAWYLPYSAWLETFLMSYICTYCRPCHFETRAAGTQRGVTYHELPKRGCICRWHYPTCTEYTLVTNLLVCIILESLLLSHWWRIERRVSLQWCLTNVQLTSRS